MQLEATRTSGNRQDEQVERIYRRTNLVAMYARARLLPAEATAFVRYSTDIVNRRVLDLGCGAGRLAIYLQPLGTAYTGFDVSRYMVDHCRREYAGTFVEGDMRDLSEFSDSSFDTVLAVSNLFDAVSHSDRLIILSEVRRVLASNGLLFFSAHNQNYAQAGQGPKLEYSRNPVTQLRLLLDYSKARSNHRQWKPHQHIEQDYALINDSGNNFASLHYYIRRDVQCSQLVTAGFQPLECMDSLGRTLSKTADDAEFPSIHYVARRSDPSNSEQR